MTAPTHSPFAVGNWLVEPERDQISTADLSLYLRPQVMEILVYLAGLEGRVASLETIHDDLWGRRVVSSGTIYNCIAELRQLLARDGSGLTYIETIPKKGYRLAAPLVVQPSAVSDPDTPCYPGIAVMPLANRSRDPEIEYLCEGIPEEFLHRLCKVGGLRVYSALKLKGEELDPRVAGLRLGATAVLSGSLQTDGTRLRLTFRLESVADGAVLWSERYEAQMRELFDLQENVAAQVVGAMSRVFQLEPAASLALQGTGTRNLAAFNAFLLGRHLSARFSQESYLEAIQALEQAVALDPDFARAHYVLHQLYWTMRRDFGADDDGYLEKARSAADAARNRGYDLPVPWVCIHRRLYPQDRLDTRGLTLEALDKIADGDPEWTAFGYEQLSWVLPVSGHFRAALDCALRAMTAPGHNYQDSDAEHLVPMYQRALGHFDEAVRRLSIAIQRDPQSNIFRRRRAVMYLRSGQPDAALIDLEAMEAGTEKDLAIAFYRFYCGDSTGLAESHALLRAVPGLHPSIDFFGNVLIGDLEAAMRGYVETVTSPRRGYVEFGPLRIWSRFFLPPALVAQVEDHAAFRGLLAAEAIDAQWSAEVGRRLAVLSEVTGVAIDTTLG